MAAMKNPQQPNLKVIGIELLLCILIPAVVTVILAIIICIAWRCWKKRSIANKANAPAPSEEISDLEIGLPSIQETPPSKEANPQAWLEARFTSGRVMQSNADGKLTVPPIQQKQKRRRSIVYPPTPVLRGIGGVDDVDEFDLGESATAPKEPRVIAILPSALMLV